MRSSSGEQCARIARREFRHGGVVERHEEPLPVADRVRKRALAGLPCSAQHRDRHRALVAGEDGTREAGKRMGIHAVNDIYSRYE